MERTRIAKVDGARLVRRGQQVDGALHLTPHHLIFVHTPSASASESAAEKPAQIKPREIWITYPIIQKCTLRIFPSWSHHLSSIRLQCRDFNFYCFCFKDEKKARDVYDSIKAWTCKLGKIEKLYAFAYQPQKPEKDVDGWSLYDARQEFKRLGISEKGTDKGWRISKINADYSFSPTYPALLVVPSNISDNTLKFAGRYRSKVRLPALTYLHPVNNCSITRCSQPLVGVRQNRSIQDEKLLLAIFSTTNPRDTLSEPTFTPPGAQTPRSSEGDTPSLTPETTFSDTEAAEDEIIAQGAASENEEKPQVYGAQQNNLIVDARPTVNAYAMQAVGMGTENMDNYPFATKAYLNIDNIHVMRQALEKVIDTLKESDITPLGPNKETLAKSGWLKYIANMLDGVGIIARQIGIQHSHVVIHCSDGWDRTSQLSSLSQLCLDPYYRTLDGFMILVEKDWLSFGHMFGTRSGHLSSEKWFSVENERAGGETGRNGSTGGSNALEDAFLKAKGFFNKDNNKSRESLVDSDSEINPMDPDYGSPKRVATPSGTTEAKHVTKVKEVSPIFHQFLDATYQLLSQYPTRFEFNERFLRRLLYHLYSCQYGTFLCNSEKERRDTNIKARTRSVWDYFLSRRAQFLNPQYDATVDDHERGKERLIFPRPREVRWWNEVFGREDAEMNGPTLSLSAESDRPSSSVDSSTAELQSQPMALSGVETAEKAIGPGTVDASRGKSPARHATLSGPSSSSPAKLQEMSGGSTPMGTMKDGLDALRSGVASLGLGKSKAAAEDEGQEMSNGDRELREMGRYEMEVEMQ